MNSGLSPRVWLSFLGPYGGDDECVASESDRMVVFLGEDEPLVFILYYLLAFLDVFW